MKAQFLECSKNKNWIVRRPVATRYRGRGNKNWIVKKMAKWQKCKKTKILKRVGGGGEGGGGGGGEGEGYS
jgi:hypothetical protein